MAAFKMAALELAKAVLIVMLCTTVVPCSAGGGLVRRERAKKTSSALQAALEHVLSGQAAKRLFGVEASVRPTFEAFPKNAMGQIPPEEIFPAIVRNYFAKEHGWQLRGLEPPSMSETGTTNAEVQDLTLLKDHAPSVAQALEDVRRSGRGLSLSDVVGTIAALEHLAIEESVALLRKAYFLNKLDTAVELDEAELHEVLQSFLLIFRYGHDGNLTSVEEHQEIKARAKKANDWHVIVDFESAAVATSEHRGPNYDFEAAMDVARDITQKYGKWQNLECVDMKATLVGMSAGTPGLAPFTTFHTEPDHGTFQFSESVEYLRSHGVVEEAADGGDTVQVLIANYLLGPTNCIAFSQYYSVCCLSECESVISDIETRTQSPVSSADDLISTVEATATSTLDAPHKLSEDVASQLRRVAELHGGAVPLHSADFKRWLHAAFPNECPLPTAPEEAAEDSELAVAGKWLEAQHVCSRLPEWHPSSDVILEV